MTDTTTTVQFWIAINSDGEFALHTDSAGDAAYELGSAGDGIRTFEMNLALPLPKPVTVRAMVPETDGPVTVTVTA